MKRRGEEDLGMALLKLTVESRRKGQWQTQIDLVVDTEDGYGSVWDKRDLGRG